MGICVSKKEGHEDGHHRLQYCFAGEGEDECSVGSTRDDHDSVILVVGGDNDDDDHNQQLYSYNVLFDELRGAKAIESGSRRWHVVRMPGSSSSDHHTVELCEFTSDRGGHHHHHNHEDDDLLFGRALHSKRIYGDLSFSSSLLSAKHPAAPRAFHDHSSGTPAAATADSSCTIAPPHHNDRLPHLAADDSSLEQQLDAAVRECYHPGHNDDHVGCLNSLGGDAAAEEDSSWIPVLSVQQSSARQERVLSIRLEKRPAAYAGGLALTACEARTHEASTITTTTTTKGSQMMQNQKMIAAAAATVPDSSSSSYIGDVITGSSAVLSQPYYQPSSHGAPSRNCQRIVGSGEIGVFGAERYFSACDQRAGGEEKLAAAMDLAVIMSSTPSERPLSTSSVCSTSAAAGYGVGQQLLQLADDEYCNDSSSSTTAMSSSWQQYRNSTGASSDVSSYDSRSALSGATRRRKNGGAVEQSSSDAGIWSSHISPNKGITAPDVTVISRAGAARGRGAGSGGRIRTGLSGTRAAAAAAAAALCSSRDQRSSKEAYLGCRWSICSGHHALADTLSRPARRRSTQVQDHHDHHITTSSPPPASAVASKSKKKNHAELQYIEPINKQDQPMPPSAKLASFLGFRRQLLSDIKHLRDHSESPDQYRVPAAATNSGSGTSLNRRARSSSPRRVSNSSLKPAEHSGHPSPKSDHHRTVLNRYPSMPSPSSDHLGALTSDTTGIASKAAYANYNTATLTKANGETGKHDSLPGSLSPPFNDRQPPISLGSCRQEETAQAGAELNLSGSRIMTSGLLDYCSSNTIASSRRACEDASVLKDSESLAAVSAFDTAGKQVTRYRSVRPFELALQHRGEELARINQQLKCTSNTANLMDDHSQIKGTGAAGDCLRKQYKPLTQLMLDADQEKVDSTCPEGQQEELINKREDSTGSGSVFSSLSMSATADHRHGSHEFFYHEMVSLQQHQQQQFERKRLSFTFPSLVSLPPSVASLQDTTTVHPEMTASDSHELYSTARLKGNIIHEHDRNCRSNYSDHGGGISTSNSTSPSGASTPTGGRSHSAFGSPFSVAACPSADYRKREELLIKRLRSINSSETSTTSTASYEEWARSNNNNSINYPLQSSSFSSSSTESAIPSSNHDQCLKDKPAAILPQQQTSSSHASRLTMEYELDSDSSSDLFDLESLATDHHQPPGLNSANTRCTAEFPVFEGGCMMMESEDKDNICVNMMPASSSTYLVDYYLSSYNNSVAIAHRRCYDSNDMSTNSSISNSTTEAHSSRPLEHDVEENIKQSIADTSTRRELQCSDHHDQMSHCNIEPHRLSISAIIRRRLSLLS